MSAFESRKAVLYLRLSTSKQTLGFDEQMRLIRQFLPSDFEIVGTCIENETGKGFDALARRPMLREAMELSKKHKAWIVVAKLDRLSRNVHFVTGLMEKRVPFVCADLGWLPDPFILHTYAALAEKERAMISQRTAGGLRAIKQKIAEDGHYTTRNGHTITALGNPNNGPGAEHALNGARSTAQKADEFALSLASQVRALQAQGATSVRKLMIAMNDAGIPTAAEVGFRSGAMMPKWHLATVQALLKRLERLDAEAARDAKAAE